MRLIANSTRQPWSLFVCLFCFSQERGALLIMCLLASAEFVHPMVDSGIPLRLINLSKARRCQALLVRVCSLGCDTSSRVFRFAG